MTQIQSVPALIRKIFQAVKSFRMYGAEHPQTQEYLKNLEAAVEFHLATGQTFTMVFQGGSLLVQEVVQPARDQSVSFLTECLSAHSISSLSIYPGVSFDELNQVVKILASKPEEYVEKGSLKESATAAFKKVSFNKVRYVAVDEGEKVVVADHSPGAAGEEGASLTRSIDGLTRALDRAGFSGGLPEAPPAPPASPEGEALPPKPELPRTAPELLNYVAERVVPGMTSAWDQLTQLVKEMSPSVRLVLGSAGKAAAPAAIVARHLQLGMDPEILRRTFQELAPGHWEAMLLFDELAKAMQKSGKTLSGESLRKLIGFLPHLEESEEPSRGRVLLVEGDAERSSAMEGALVELAYTVEKASTAKEAIEKLGSGKPVDAIVLQLDLPDKRGTVVVSHLQASKLVVPVVMVGDKATIDACDFEVFSYPRKRIVPSQEPKLVAHAVAEFVPGSESASDELRKADLEHAREFQKKLAPVAMPPAIGWELDFVQEQAENGGGDLLDAFRIDGERVGMLLGEVSGRGTAAALATVMVRSTFRLSVTPTVTPLELVAAVNRLIAPDLRRGTFLTLVYAGLHLPSGRLSLVNCGQSPPIVYDSREVSVQTLPAAQGLPMGLAAAEKFEGSLKQEELEIHPGGQVLFHTDGVIEVQNDRSVPLLQRPLLEVVKRWGAVSSPDLLKAIEAAIRSHRGPAARSKTDDITLLAVRRSPEG